MKHGDIIFGAIGTLITWVLNHVNAQSLALLAGLFTVGVMAFRFGSAGIQFMKDWRHRND